MKCKRCNKPITTRITELCRECFDIEVNRCIRDMGERSEPEATRIRQLDSELTALRAQLAEAKEGQRAMQVELVEQIMDLQNEAYHLKQLLASEREKRERLEGIAEGVLTALCYPRGSEAQVRCLEEVGDDARRITTNP